MYNPWIQNLVEVVVPCGISDKDAKWKQSVEYQNAGISH
jgi:hypothetical protein